MPAGGAETLKNSDYQVTAWTQRMAGRFVSEGSICIDATMGNGNDTEFLCRHVGPEGQVLAFDIQEEAIEHTGERLRRKGYRNARLILDSHTRMADYVEPESADLIMFNLGYLPGGDHRIATKPETTLPALESALTLLKKGGAVSLVIYSGGDTGTEEKERILDWLKHLDAGQYLVMVTEYYNRPNHPPLPVLIIRLQQ